MIQNHMEIYQVSMSGEAVVFSDWRNDTPTYYEGEWVTGEKAVNGRGGALYYMPEEFDKEIIWTSNGKFIGPDDVMNSFSEGCGFAFFSGHGSPNYWGDQYPGIPGNRQYGSAHGLVVSNLQSYPPFITDRPIWPMDELSNTGKLPITVVGGCHNSQFNVSLISSAIHYYTMRLGRNNWMWTYLTAVPQCWSWYLVQLPETGAIATIGNMISLDMCISRPRPVTSISSKISHCQSQNVGGTLILVGMPSINKPLNNGCFWVILA
jgi:hypothetical protein